MHHSLAGKRFDFLWLSQAGAVTGTVLLTMGQAGPANAGFWATSLDRAYFAVTIEYLDAELTGGGQSWAMDCEQSGCVSNEY